jgi:hypothetical protein
MRIIREEVAKTFKRIAREERARAQLPGATKADKLLAEPWARAAAKRR